MRRPPVGVVPRSRPWDAILFGYRDPANYFFLSIDERNDVHTSGLFRVADGTLTQLADVSTPVRTGRAYTARVDLADGRVRAFLDGRPVAEAAAEVLAGQVGLGSRNNAVTADDLLVTASGAGTEPTGSAGPTGSPTATPTPTPSSPPPGTGSGPRCTGTLLDADFEAGNLSEFDGKEALDSELRVVPDPAGGSGKAARVEVREDQRDQGGGRWRAELTQEGAGGARQQRDRCFALSTYLPADWSGTQPNILFQVHERPDACEDWRQPVLTLNVDGDSMRWGSKYDTKACSGKTPEGSSRISASPVVKGAWVDWVVRVRWSYGSDGLVEVWQNGKQVGRSTGPNSYNDGKEMYLKVGNYVYAGFEDTDRVVSYVDNVRMGTTLTGD